MRLLSLFLLVFFTFSQTLAAPVIQISFTGGAPQTSSYNIDSLANISSIYTAGPYSWAADAQAGKYAFYNGQHWNAVTIPGATSITTISPAYPVTGQNPSAWALISTSKGPAISYFNGVNWSQTELIQQILGGNSISGYSFSIATSGGAVFLESKSSSNNIMFLSVKTPSTRWHTRGLQTTLAFLKNMDVFDDNNPLLNFVGLQLSTQKPMFYQLDTTGNIIKYPRAMNAPAYGFTIENLIAAGSHVVLNYTDTVRGSTYAYKDLSTHNDWQHLASAAPGSDYSFTADRYNNGLLCQMNIIDSKANGTTFECLDSNQLETQWQQWPLALPQEEADSYQILTRADGGAWLNFYAYNIVHPGDDAIVEIYTYDMKSNTATNINFPLTEFPKTRASVVTEVGTDNLMACVGDAQGSSSQQPVQLYYYSSGQGWYTIHLSNTPVTKCGYSFSGSPSHGELHRVNPDAGETLWIFNTPYPSSDQDRTIIHYNKRLST